LAALVFFLLRWDRNPIASREEGASPPPLQQRIEAGQQALAEGSFLRARALFADAIDLRNRDPDQLRIEQTRRLFQLHRESDLLARLLSDSLQDIISQAARVRDEDEWKALFRERHFGKTVVFDDVVHRDAQGRPALTNYQVVIGPKEHPEIAQVALGDLKVLHEVPLDPPPRVLFGARLASCEREDGGVWVIRFGAESGVLFTDRAAAETCCPKPLESDLLEVLSRQQQWLQEMPGLRPASF
jgi:hypothetical protein